MKNLIDQRLKQQQLQQKQQQLAQHQLAQQQQLAQQHLAQQQLAQQEQLALQENYDNLVTQMINISGGNITISGNSQITCDSVTVTGGNNHIVSGTTAPITTPPLKEFDYPIYFSLNNNTPFGCNCVSSGDGFSQGNPGASIYLYANYSGVSTTDNNTVVFTFTDNGWKYTATFAYGSAPGGTVVASFNSDSGYNPISMIVTAGGNQVTLNSNNGTGNVTVCGTMNPGSSFNIKFNSIYISPINLQLNISNGTPYDLTFDEQVVPTGSKPLSLPVIKDIQYDVNAPITNNFSFNWPNTRSTPGPILTGGVFLFNASGDPSISIDMGKETSVLNYNDIKLIVKLVDANSSKTISTSNILIPGSGVNNIFAIGAMKNYINSYKGTPLTLNANFEFTANRQQPLVNNFVFTNNTPYPVTITPGDSTSGATNPIPAGGIGSWTELIQPYDNYIVPAIVHEISWAAGPIYTGNCVTTLNTSNSGTGIVCTLANVLNSGITTDLRCNGKPIVPDQDGYLAVSQESMNLPRTTPNTYAVTLTAASVTDCVYNLVVNDNTSSSHPSISGYYTGANSSTPTIIPIPSNNTITVDVPNGTTLEVNLQWTGFSTEAPYPWGGPTVITVTCNPDGTGTINTLDRGKFSLDYQPSMSAIPGSNQPFIQSGDNSPPTSFPNLLPATGGQIVLGFSDPQLSVKPPVLKPKNINVIFKCSNDTPYDLIFEGFKIPAKLSRTLPPQKMLVLNNINVELLNDYSFNVAGTQHPVLTGGQFIINSYSPQDKHPSMGVFLGAELNTDIVLQVVILDKDGYPLPPSSPILHDNKLRTLYKYNELQYFLSSYKSLNIMLYFTLKSHSH